MAVGLQFVTALASGPNNAAGDPNARTFFAGITERGPTVATKVVSLANYSTIYGVRQSYAGSLYDAVQTFFAEGGSELYVARVVGPGAVKALLTLVDRAGTPLPTLRITALEPGAFPNTNLAVTVTAGSISGYTLTVFNAGVQVEQFANLADPPAAVTATAGVSNYILVTNLASVTVAPNNLPAILASTFLATGADDRASVTATTIGAAFSAFGSDLGPGAVAAPGYTGDLVGTALIAHCVANNRIALLSGAVTAVLGDLQAIVTTLQTANPTTGDFAGLFAPWVLIPSGATTAAIDPVSYVAGVRARAINRGGLGSSPAGTVSNAKFVVGIATPLDGATNNTYNDNSINGITVYRGVTRLYGYRSLSKDVVNFYDLTPRAIANGVLDLVHTGADPYVFATIDGTGLLFGQIESAIIGELDAVAKNSAFYAAADGSDPGYTVTVSAASNLISGSGANTVLVSVAFRPSPTADLIKVSIIIAGLGVAI